MHVNFFQLMKIFTKFIQIYAKIYKSILKLFLVNLKKAYVSVQRQNFSTLNISVNLYFFLFGFLPNFILCSVLQRFHKFLSKNDSLLVFRLTRLSTFSADFSQGCAKHLQYDRLTLSTTSQNARDAIYNLCAHTIDNN